MKTQILQLEAHDDVISARDKMGWGQTGRILLVWPPRGRLLTRRLDLLLLRRHSQRLNARLALVTRDRRVRTHARTLGIPAFHSIQEAQTQPWRRDRRSRRKAARLPGPAIGKEDGHDRPTLDDLHDLRHGAHPPPAAWMLHPLPRLIVFGLGVVALLAIAALLIPRAEVSLRPEVRRQTTAFTAQASPDVEAITLSGILPSRTIEVTVEGRDSIATTGTTTLPGSPATGLIELENVTNREIEIPEGTTVRTIGTPTVRFMTTRNGTLAPGPGRRIIIPIRAIDAGTQGNLPADTITTVDGPLRLLLTATNPYPTHGGTDLTSPAPTKSNRERLHQSLLEALQGNATEELEFMLSPGDVLLTQSPEMSEVLEEVYDPSMDTPADRLFLTLRVTFSAQVVAEEDVETLARTLLDASIPTGFQQGSSEPAVRHTSRPQSLTTSDGTVYRWRVEAEREIYARLPTAQAARLASGLPVREAQIQLGERLRLEGAPDISLSPTWWPRLPYLPFRIQIEQADA